MKIADIFESINNTTKFIIDRNNKIKKYLKDFNALVDANGYENTEVLITNFLNSITQLAIQILNYYTTVDASFKQQYDIYQVLEKQLRDKVKSGISYE